MLYVSRKKEAPTKKEQSNNKGDNIKVVNPLNGEPQTSHDLVKLTGLSLKTIYNLKAKGASFLEMLAGKLNPILAEASARLAALTRAPATTMAPSTPQTPAKPEFDDTQAPPKARGRSLIWPSGWRQPDYDDYNDGADDPIFWRDRCDHVALKRWFLAWNSGEPCPLHPPKTVWAKSRKITPDRVVNAKGDGYVLIGDGYSPPAPTPVIVLPAPAQQTDIQAADDGPNTVQTDAQESGSGPDAATIKQNLCGNACEGDFPAG